LADFAGGLSRRKQSSVDALPVSLETGLGLAAHDFAKLG
jgi:hypothetical protein